MKRTHLRFGEGFRVALGNRRTQAAEMVLSPGQSEGDGGNRHRGADQWLYVVAGTGVGVLKGRRVRLSPGTLSITSITRWKRSRSLSITMSKGVVTVPSSL